MGFLNQLNDYVNSRNGGDVSLNENLTLDFLKKLDFSDPKTQQDAYETVREIMLGSILANKDLSRTYMKGMHYMIVKLRACEMGVPSTKVKYEPANKFASKKYDAHADGDSLVFCEDVFFSEEILSAKNTQHNRLVNFVGVIGLVCHELQHIVQDAELERVSKNPDEMTPINYIMQLQRMAREIADGVYSSKYYNYSESLYDVNHDNFLIELDSDLMRAVGAQSFVKKVCPEANGIAQYFNSYKDEKEKAIAEYNSITWNHWTNPNDGPVRAMHKTSMIIDSMWSEFTQSQRDSYLLQYPALGITRNLNGTKKSLEEIESDRALKIAEVKANSKGSDASNKISQILKIYDAAIEQDAMLCFEKYLRHMSRISKNAPSFFIKPDGSLEVNENYFLKSMADITNELRMSAEKVKQVAAYIEDFDVVELKTVFEKYKRELLKVNIHDYQDEIIYDLKKRAVYAVESSLFLNKDNRRVEKESRKTREEEKLKREEAIKILKNVFPDLDPKPKIDDVVGSVPVIRDNVFEKLQLMKAEESIRGIPHKYPKILNDPNYISDSYIRLAIHRIYHFAISDEERDVFEAMIAENPDYLKIRTKYSYLEDSGKKSNSQQSESTAGEGEKDFQ